MRDNQYYTLMLLSFYILHTREGLFTASVCLVLAILSGYVIVRIQKGK